MDMAALLPSTTRGRYAVAAVLLLLTVAAGVVTMQRWNGNGSGLFGGGFPQDDKAVVSDGSAGMSGIGAVDNVLGALLGRSPGERTVGISGKGKGKGPARAYRYARTPAAQALQDAFDTPIGANRVIDDRPSPAAGPAITLPGALAAVPPAGLVLPVVPEGGVIGGPGGGFFGPPGGFSVGGGGGGGGGNPPVEPPVNPPVVPPVTPPPPVAPVPEPSTWIMLLLGMAAVGGALRSGKENGPAVSLKTR